uniref:hypothetical protein n=1 Tax=Flavobacterium sp. TaxID=239 RepID=UPI00404B3491
MKSISKMTFGVFMLFLMTACTLESRFGLSNDEAINPALIGTWYLEKDRTQQITVQKNDDKSYKLLIKDQDKTDVLISYAKTIKGFTIINVQTKENDKITNLFYGFKVKNNNLIFSEVNAAFREKPFKSEAELLKFFEENIDKEDFFINPTVLNQAF